MTASVLASLPPVAFVSLCLEFVADVDPGSGSIKLAHNQYLSNKIGGLGTLPLPGKESTTAASKIAETTLGNAYFHLCIHPSPSRFDSGDASEVGSSRNPPRIGPKLEVRQEKPP